MRPHAIGLLAARFPIAALVFLAVVSGLAVWGVTLNNTNYSLNALFKSDTPLYRSFQSFRDEFPISERDIIIVLSSGGSFSRADIQRIQDLHLDLELEDGIDGVISMFTMRGKPGPDGSSQPLFPEQLPDGEALEKLLGEVATNPFVDGVLLGPADGSGQSAVIIAGLSQDAASVGNLFQSVDSVKTAIDESLEGSALRFELFGAPVIQVEVRRVGKEDRIKFNLAGLLVGLLMCALFFRNLRYVAIVTTCPVLSVLWTFGFIGFTGKEITFFMNMTPPLLMVIAFSNAMHLTYGIQRHLRSGEDVATAVHQTLLNVAPACGLAILTTAVALGSLALSESDAIRDFGTTGAVGMGITFFVSMVVIPTLSLLLLNKPASEPTQPAAPTGHHPNWRNDLGLTAASARLSHWVPRHDSKLVILGIVLLVGFATMHFRLEPHFRLTDELPNVLSEKIASAEQSTAMVSSSPLYMVMRYPGSLSAADKPVQEALADAHSILEGAAEIGNVWSLDLLAREIDPAESNEDGGVASLLADLPDHIRHRLVNQQTRAFLLTAHLSDLEAKDIRRIANHIDMQMEPLRRIYPEFGFELTGMALTSAMHATVMIPQLTNALLLAVLVVIVLLGIAFRSIAVSVLALVPNLLPIVTAGALLYVLGWGIDYASAIALTIAFGLAVDDSIHFLARFRNEQRKGADVADAVALSMRRVGPVLMITTVVLICGISVTVFGQMPQTRTFGALCSVTLVFALVADLLVLPSSLLLWQRFEKKIPYLEISDLK
jgi:hypothetical protein